ncbi:MAG: response regulator [Anaerolineae bacterium]|nr:response regulator [Anaerolineae bacterium]MDQ7036562.1 response regulator [Anaerolineae bacterium]
MTTILYIEDVMFNRRLVRKCLRMMDYSYVEAVDGYEGLEKARETQPDLILIDIHLPDINGIEVARQLREIEGMEKIPFVALTADITQQVEEQCLTGDFDAILNKPISRARLLSVIQQLLRTQEVL